jgi:flavin-dependent dehydrogenase
LLAESLSHHAPTDFDVVIAGAGPAGCATAISLADVAPELRICIVDASAGDALRVGETVPPLIRPILAHLKLWARFVADGHSPSYRTLSAWGSAELASNEFLFQTEQVGWRLDRARFDAMMLAAATERIAGHAVTTVAGLDFADGQWRIALRDGTSLSARCAVDATGRSATLARLHGLRPRRHDRLVGAIALYEDAADDGEGLLIETFADGWWYTAAIPGGRRVVACMCDADVVRPLGLGQMDRWTALLAQTRHVRGAIAAARACGRPEVRPAGSRQLSGETPLPLLCVGDAASCFDPVSGQGIIKALRSGIFASYATADLLCRNDRAGLTRYHRFVDDEFTGYLQSLRTYYALEARWPDRAFWQRRRSSSRPRSG